MSIGTSIQIGARNLGRTLAKESPTILTGLGVMGVATTAILAVRATPKALYLLEQAKKERRKNKDNGLPKEITKIDIIKITWKCYIPAALVGTATVGCIVGANSINLRRNAALAGIYSLTETAFREYQEKVVEQIGKSKEERIRDEIAQDQIDRDPLTNKEVIITGKGETLFYDSLSGRYFRTDMETVRRIQNDFNQEILGGEMYKPLNDLYEELGLEGTDLGKDMGWSIDHGLLDIRFSSKIAKDGVPCIVLDYKLRPRKL